MLRRGKQRKWLNSDCFKSVWFTFEGSRVLFFHTGEVETGSNLCIVTFAEKSVALDDLTEGLSGCLRHTARQLKLTGHLTEFLESLFYLVVLVVPECTLGVTQAESLIGNWTHLGQRSEPSESSSTSVAKLEDA